MRLHAKYGAFFAAFCVCALVFACIGCRTPQPVADGIHQEGYWLARGNVPKAKEVNDELKKGIQGPSMPISENTHYVVIHNMREYKSLWGVIKGVAAGFLGLSPGTFDAILGAVLTALGGGGVWKLFREVKKRKNAEGRADKAQGTADDCYEVLESEECKDKTPGYLKREIAKRQANRHDGFGRNDK